MATRFYSAWCSGAIRLAHCVRPGIAGIGALSADGDFSFGVALLVTLGARLCRRISSGTGLGRRRGYGVLRILCRLSSERTPA